MASTKDITEISESKTETTEPNEVSASVPDFTEIKTVFQETQSFLKNYIVIIVIAFLAMFVLLRVFGGGENSMLGAMVSNMIDLFALVVLFTWVGYDFLFTYSGEERQAKLKEFLDSSKSYINDPYSILYTSLFIAVFYTLVYTTGIPMEGNARSIFVNMIDKGAWIILFVSLLNWVLSFFGIRLFDGVIDSTTKTETATEDDKPTQETTQGTGEEVFNIGNNRYTYEDAQSICKSYGARLATYDEIEDAYNKGAEWCSYGWSEGQMAYFPTQKATWSELQKDEKRKNDCGRPGVNGGYMANPYLRFGVNCYGKKPAPTPSELAKMQVRKEKVVPKTKEDVILDMKVKFWKENADKLLNINAFNQDKWSQVGGTTVLPTAIASTASSATLSAATTASASKA